MPRKRRKKRVIGDYIRDKTDRRIRGEEAVINFIKPKRILKTSYITEKVGQKKLIFISEREINKLTKIFQLKEDDIVRISLKTNFGTGRIGKIEEIDEKKVRVKIIFRDGIYPIDFPFQFFIIEKANKSEKNQYESWEERIYAKEVAEKL
jgi:hypothetical protein